MDLMGVQNSRQQYSTLKTSKSAVRSNTFQVELSRARKANQTEDTVQVSNASFEDRLKLVEQQHKDTDYSNMSTAEKLRAVNQRFETAFPNFVSITSGVLGGAEYHGTGQLDRLVHTYQVQTGEALEGTEWYKSAQSVMREARFGDMSDDEIRAAVSKKYKGGSILDRAGALYELMEVGLDNGIGGIAIFNLQFQLTQSTYGGRFQGLEASHPVRRAAMFEKASNTKMNWTQIAHSLLEEAAHSSHQIAGMSPSEAAAKHQQELEKNLKDFLENMMKY